MIEGVDASAFQGSLDWTKLRPKHDFGIFRCSYGTANDTTFAEHVAGCSASGAVPIAYHYFSVLKPAGPQIETVAHQVTRAGLADQRFALDVEDTPSVLVGQHLSAWFADNRNAILDNLRAAVQCSVEVLGTKPILYTYPYYWLALGPNAMDPSWADLPLWISAPTYALTPPKIPAPWPSWSFWQYSDDANVVVKLDGYPGPHALCDRFNGSVDDLIAL